MIDSHVTYKPSTRLLEQLIVLPLFQINGQTIQPLIWDENTKCWYFVSALIDRILWYRYHLTILTILLQCYSAIQQEQHLVCCSKMWLHYIPKSAISLLFYTLHITAPISAKAEKNSLNQTSLILILSQSSQCTFQYW